MAGYSWSRLVAIILLQSMLAMSFSNELLASCEMTAMPANALIEWTKTANDLEESAGGVPDITVFDDGRVRLGPRLGNGEITWHRLPQGKLQELRSFVLGEQRIMDIEREGLSRAVQAAAAQRQKAMDSSAAILSTTPQMDASTTVLRASDADRVHEVRYYDLFGDAQRYPEIEALQRLRMIELRMLQIIEAYAAQR